MIDGNCPELLRDLLEVRGLGVLNVREMFGHTAVKPSKYLRLIVHLKPQKLRCAAATRMTRLTGDVGYREVLDVQVPMITIPVAPGPQHRGAGRSRRAQPHAEEQGHRSGADLHRPPGAPAAPTAAMVNA